MPGGLRSMPTLPHETKETWTMRYTYPVRFIVNNDEIEVVVRDFPQVVTAGASMEEAREMAEDSITVMLEIFLEDGLAIPTPSPAETGEELISVELP